MTNHQHLDYFMGTREEVVLQQQQQRTTTSNKQDTFGALLLGKHKIKVKFENCRSVQNVFRQRGSNQPCWKMYVCKTPSKKRIRWPKTTPSLSFDKRQHHADVPQQNRPPSSHQPPSCTSKFPIAHIASFFSDTISMCPEKNQLVGNTASKKVVWTRRWMTGIPASFAPHNSTTFTSLFRSSLWAQKKLQTYTI